MRDEQKATLRRWAGVLITVLWMTGIVIYFVNPHILFRGTRVPLTPPRPEPTPQEAALRAIRNRLPDLELLRDEEPGNYPPTRKVPERIKEWLRTNEDWSAADFAALDDLADYTDPFPSKGSFVVIMEEWYGPGGIEHPSNGHPAYEIAKGTVEGLRDSRDLKEAREILRSVSPFIWSRIRELKAARDSKARSDGKVGEKVPK